jgi:predicted O-methyltransferase YrrM
MKKLCILEEKDWILTVLAGILLGAVGMGLRTFGWLSESRIILVLAMFAGGLMWTVLFLYRRLQKEIRIEANHIEGAIALYRVIGPRLPLPAFGETAIEADTARELVSLVLQRRPRRVVECGSGLSTLLVGYALEKLGEGQILSMEHLVDWSDMTRTRIEQHGLQRHAVVFHAPLEEIEVPGMRSWKWYDPNCWVEWKQIDLLIIDGPPAWKDESARYPALPLLWNYLSDGAIIFLDDTGRPGEKAVIAKWLTLYPGRLSRKDVETSKGLTLLTVSKG